MLYSAFRIMMVLCAPLGILYMIYLEQYSFIIFPIGIIIWGLYALFYSNDSEYIRRNCSYDDGSYWDYYGDNVNNNYHRTTYNTNRSTTNNSGRSTTVNEWWNKYGNTSKTTSKDYKELARRCKRNFKISID